MNRQRGSSSDLAEARIQLLAPNAMRIMRFASSLPPDRPCLRHVLLPQLDVAQDAARLAVHVREGIVHVQTRDGATVLAEARAPRRSRDDHVHLRVQRSGSVRLKIRLA